MREVPVPLRSCALQPVVLLAFSNTLCSNSVVMRLLVRLLIVLSLAVPATRAQTDFAGTWRVSGPNAENLWELVLIEDQAGLLGAVSSCIIRRPTEIGNLESRGNAISFECDPFDGRRIVSFEGVIRGDEIEFSWSKSIAEGLAQSSADKMFGDGAPPRFTAVKVDSPASNLAEYAARIRRSPAVDFERILNAGREPKNWLTYSGTLSGERHSLLTQINPENVENLELAWLWQAQNFADQFEATSLVVDGVLYTVQAPNDVVALDAKTGEVLWTYSYKPLAKARASGGGGIVNRGLAILDDKLFLGTLDAHLIAIQARNGELVWDAPVADPLDCVGLCYSITMAPLVVEDRVLVGVGGGEGPTRGFIAAYAAETGEEVWRFYTIPAPGEPGNETWSGDSWKTGGGGVWNTGSYDPDLNLTYWGVGNPYPWRTRLESEGGAKRLGDNLYTESVVALEAETGQLRWHYQFTPHDNMDWDSAAVPVLAEIPWQGERRRVLLFANRNGLFYVLDRATGEFLMGKPFVEVNWMTGFDDQGRPLIVPGMMDTREGGDLHPGIAATNWYPPSYSPSTELFYIPAWERQRPPRRPSPSYGAIRAIYPKTGEQAWEFRRSDAVFQSGVLTTASDLLFTGVWGDFYSGDEAASRADRYFYALNARTGELLWQVVLAGSVQGGPMSYSVDGTQYVAVTAGNTLYAFALRP